MQVTDRSVFVVPLCLHFCERRRAGTGEVFVSAYAYFLPDKEAEMTIGEITKLVNEEGKTKEEQLQMLRKIRSQLLEVLHCKQQLLDQIDYLIYEIRERE